MTPSIDKCNFLGLLLGCWFCCHTAAAQTILPQQDSINVAIAPDYNDVSKRHRFWFGDNYRALWATPVKLRVFRLGEERGGMTILQRGGGQQTKSLRLADPTGKEWVLRTVQKDPEKALPENLRETVAKDIVQDQISASHPFGALVVPPLAEALNVLHTNPEIVYLPNDPALPDSLAEYANAVYLFEEREPIRAGVDTDNTETVLENLEEDNDNRVNQQAVLRARLLDMVIGDWDRHEDQWRWRELEDETGDYYDPIPRDRDQIFFKNEGLIPKIGSRKWIMPKFQGFDEEIRGIEGFNFNARYFDRMFLSHLGEEDWREEVNFVQQQLTDEVVDRAVRRMPPVIYKQSGPEIARKIKARRDNLQEQALTYYRFLAKGVDIPGSDKHEEFLLDYLPGGDINLKVYKILKEGTRDRLLLERTFSPGTTEELRLYGRGDEDVFTVQGNEKSAIRVRLIGGGSADRFNVGRDFRNKGKLLIYDRSDEENTLPAKGMAKLRTSTDTIVNDYNPRSFKYNQLMPLATVGYNLDDGILLGLGFKYTKHGFRKEPYAAQHKLLVGHALATNAFFGSYEGDFPHLLGKFDLGVELDAKAPNNTSNFFGVGNNTEFIDEGDKPIRYYRTRYDFVEAQVVLRRQLTSRFQMYGGVTGQFFSMQPGDNEGRFINLYQVQHQEENLFESNYYSGLVGGFSLDTRDDSLQPSRGLIWNTSMRGVGQLNDEKEKYGQLQSELGLYFKLSKKFVVANRMGGGTTYGDPAFFQLLYLGGTNNLRGFRNYRFAGEQMLYHNLELRLKLFDFTSYLLPGSVGLIGFNDVGRVWAENGDDGGGLHHGYGGGLYVLPAELILLHGVVGFSEEGVLPYFSVGFRF
ncbi:BamA/TamA family outer membrane protein [Pontibacter anaerobius]|uniref:BamA/TamA family outer membrane protein n=1 Tax=Pontibacter anaerobius TaxID=2993940 RepID=A0ABT3RDV4_9BACT|nr:BamA/TamA family outer membrane protein [Pontibacter anaerobius]MCX2739681.1 BamA/TamA family outer membrane protein [Pontibacter anaerobius]